MIHRIALSLSIVFGSIPLSLLKKTLPMNTLLIKSTESSEAASPMAKVFSLPKVPLNLARRPTYSIQVQKALSMVA